MAAYGGYNVIEFDYRMPRQNATTQNKTANPRGL